jgi:predicted ATPase
VREYFGEQLRTERAAAWQARNRRLYQHYRALAPELPESFRNMEPLFLAVTCGCQAGLYRQALHEIYIPRIQRGEAAFAANVLGARGALLSALAHFFEGGRWDAVVQGGATGQNLTAEDQLFILMQAGMHLTAIRGMGAPEARVCYERAEALCQSLQRPLALYWALIGQWLFSLVTDKLSVTMRIAQRVYALAQWQDNATLMINACGTLASPLYLMGEFEAAYQHASRGVQLWRSDTPFKIEEIVSAPVVICLSFKALCEWHLGEIDASHTTTAQTISLAKALGDMYALAEALFFATMLCHFERKATEVECLASDLIDLSTRHHFALYVAGGEMLCGWARSVSNRAAEGLACLENGIKDWRATGAILFMPYWLTLKAEALFLADRTYEAIDAIKEAEGLIESSTERWCCAELHRLHGVFLTALGAEEAEIEASFCAAIRIAKEQKSISLAKRTEATYAEYRRKSRKALEG